MLLRVESLSANDLENILTVICTQLSNRCRQASRFVMCTGKLFMLQQLTNNKNLFDCNYYFFPAELSDLRNLKCKFIPVESFADARSQTGSHLLQGRLSMFSVVVRNDISSWTKTINLCTSNIMKGVYFQVEWNICDI